MKTLKLMHKIRDDKSTRIHIIMLYLLIAILTILWGLYFIYFSRTIRAQVTELNLIKQRLSELEGTQIIISSSTNEDDALQRRSRHARIKSKLLHKQQQAEESNSLFGSVHFKVPVRKKKI
jgi:hypothetical protein